MRTADLNADTTIAMGTKESWMCAESGAVRCSHEPKTNAMSLMSASALTRFHFVPSHQARELPVDGCMRRVKAGFRQAAAAQFSRCPQII